MLVREMFWRQATLRIMLVSAVAALGVLAGNADATVLWSEDFDNLASGTVLTDANMPGWTMVSPVSGEMMTTNESSASSPNAIRGCPSERGLMLHDATGVNELRFSFYRREKTNASYPSATAEIGFTSDAGIDAWYHIMNGPKIVFYSHATAGEALGFYTREDINSPFVSQWDLLGVLSDSTWYDGLIRFENDGTLTFGYRALGDTDFVLSGAHASISGFSPTYVGVAAFQHSLTNGRAFLDNIIADDGASVVPEPTSVVSWTMLGICGLFFTWRRRRRSA